jgi:hypothetical protein
MQLELGRNRESMVMPVFLKRKSQGHHRSIQALLVLIGNLLWLTEY